MTHLRAGTPTVPQLRSCARRFLSQPGLLIPLCAEADYAGSSLSGVTHAYLIHYTRNVHRLSVQRQQHRELKINTSIVTAYDAEQLSNSVRKCLLGAPPEGVEGWPDLRKPENTPYASQSVKLYVALWDMVARALPMALILEDDAAVRPQYLPLLRHALQKLAGNFTVVHAGSYHAKGSDLLKLGLHPKPPVMRYRSGGMMAATGSVLSARGAWHVLLCLPIVAPIDRALSDSFTCSGSAPDQWYVKQYAFVPSIQSGREWIGARRNGTGANSSYLKMTSLRSNATGCSAPREPTRRTS
mmetsp:Transcript_7894/g.17311  ORF Transcript_7894/g.17311 Transcript_7894/m.17311 type:complete len:299 (+) Transcript_7894:2-898(+)